MVLRSAYNETSLQDEGVARAKVPYIGRRIDPVRLLTQVGKHYRPEWRPQAYIRVSQSCRQRWRDHGAVLGQSQAE